MEAGSIFGDSPLPHLGFRGLVSPGGSFQHAETAGESGPAEVSPGTGHAAGAGAGAGGARGRERVLKDRGPGTGSGRRC